MRNAETMTRTPAAVNEDTARAGTDDLSGYALGDGLAVRRFLEENAGMRPFLRRALTHVREAFGDVTPRLSVDRSEVAAPDSLLVSIPAPGGAAGALAAMDRFEDGWWLDALPEAPGPVNFTVEFSPAGLAPSGEAHPVVTA